MMTKKDYIAIATIIREHLENNRKCVSTHNWDISNGVEPMLSREFLDARGMLLYELASQLSGTFEASNPAFDRYKFYSACSIPPIGSKILSA
jgi:hypothetical protein